VSDLCMVGACRDWVASAVIDFGLVVQWASRLAEVSDEVEEAKAGVLVLRDDALLSVGIRDMRRLAGRWVVLQDAPGWGGERLQRTAGVSCGALGLELVRHPGGPWTAKARRYNLQSREALGEILEAVGLARNPVGLALARR